MYSNSRIEAFEQCPRKYKYRYIDNIKTDTEGIEAFVGKRVHETLEKLYRDLKLTKMNSLEDMLAFYEDAWEKNWHGKVTVVRSAFTPAHYFAKGQQCLKDYYKRYAPFNHGKTLGLEERIEMKVGNGEKKYTVQGYIDRLAWVPEQETYEIHDYKTGDTVPTQEQADQDRQLALYQLGLMQRWPDAKKVKLVWHYLSADKEIVSTRTAADLQSLEKEVVDVIHQIEREAQSGKWDVRVTRLCDWCEYKIICPAWKHAVAMEALPPNVYLQDNGVQLVQKYAELEERKADLQAQVKTIENEQAKIDEAVLAYSEKEQVTAIDGPGYRLLIKSDDEWKIPRKVEDPLSWELLRTTLKNAGKLEDVSTVNGRMLQWAVKKGKWPEALVKSIASLVTQGVRKTVQLVRK
jgi:putative RecB family exonuclease